MIRTYYTAGIDGNASRKLLKSDAFNKPTCIQSSGLDQNLEDNDTVLGFGYVSCDVSDGRCPLISIGMKIITISSRIEKNEDHEPIKLDNSMSWTKIENQAHCEQLNTLLADVDWENFFIREVALFHQAIWRMVTIVLHQVVYPV